MYVQRNIYMKKHIRMYKETILLYKTRQHTKEEKKNWVENCEFKMMTR